MWQQELSQLHSIPCKHLGAYRSNWEQGLRPCPHRPASDKHPKTSSNLPWHIRGQHNPLLPAPKWTSLSGYVSSFCAENYCSYVCMYVLSSNKTTLKVWHWSIISNFMPTCGIHIIIARCIVRMYQHLVYWYPQQMEPMHTLWEVLKAAFVVVY